MFSLFPTHRRPRPLRQSAPVRVALAVVMLAVGMVSAEAQFARESSLTRAERARLERGEIVLRQVEEERGSLDLIGGTSFQIIDLPADTVWASLRGSATTVGRMLPQVHRARQRSWEGNVRHITFEHEVGPISAVYTLRFQYDSRNRVVLFRLDDSQEHSIDAAWGFLKIRSHGDNRCRVTFGAMVDLGVGFLSAAVQPVVHEWMLKIPWTMDQYLMRRERRRRRGR